MCKKFNFDVKCATDIPQMCKSLFSSRISLLQKKNQVGLYGRLIMCQNCKKKTTLQDIAKWGGGGQKESWHFMSADPSMIWRGRIKSFHLSPKLTQKKKVLRYNFRLAPRNQIFFFLQSNFHGHVPGGHPVQGRRNQECPHFFGQPKSCPFLTFNTLHNVR